MSVSLVRNAWKLSHQPDHSEHEAAELQKLQDMSNKLQNDIEKEQQPYEKEKVIRDELNMQKEGEIIIQLPPLPSPTPHPTIVPSPTPAIYQKWWDVFF